VIGLQARVTQLGATNSALNEEVNLLTVLYDHQQAEHLRLVGKTTTQDAEVEHLRAETEDHRASERKLREELAEARGAGRRPADGVESLQRERDAALLRIEAMTMEVAALKDRCTDLEDANRTLLSSSGNRAASLRTQSDEILKLKDELKIARDEGELGFCAVYTHS
jgi:chromosome segregation ATPase